MSNVIHADFRPKEFEATVVISTEVLYRDEHVMLVRSRILGATTHLLAHRASQRVDVIPVDA